VNTNPADIATSIAKALENAWNAGDAQAFGEQLADYVDFVDIRGDYHRGKQPVIYGHAALFDSIFKGSVNRYDVLSARFLAPGLVSAQVGATLNCPAGPMAGENHSTLTFVAKENNGQWKVEVFHNTLKPRELDPAEAELRERIR
jgi:uncharacterized protein (TIGR02246 family)